MIPIETILDEFGKNLVTDLRAALNAKGVGYGGQDSKLAAQIRFRIIPKDNGIYFHLLIPGYAEFVDRGRRPGPVSKKGIEKIGEWAKAKGIVGNYQDKELKLREERQNESKQNAKSFSKQGKRDKAVRKWKTLKKLPFNRAKKQLAFAIASKIRAKGYEGKNFFTDTINDGRLDILATDLKDYGLENFKFDI